MSNLIQIFLILVSLFLSRHFFLCNFILTSILVVLLLWSLSNFLLPLPLLDGDIEMNAGPKLISKKIFSSFIYFLQAFQALQFY